jgi:hypothetical protein
MVSMRVFLSSTRVTLRGAPFLVMVTIALVRSMPVAETLLRPGEHGVCSAPGARATGRQRAWRVQLAAKPQLQARDPKTLRSHCCIKGLVPGPDCAAVPGTCANHWVAGGAGSCAFWPSPDFGAQGGGNIARRRPRPESIAGRQRAALPARWRGPDGHGLCFRVARDGWFGWWASSGRALAPVWNCLCSFGPHPQRPQPATPASTQVHLCSGVRHRAVQDRSRDVRYRGPLCGESQTHCGSCTR